MIKDFPFSLGATSLTYPNLDLIENVKRTSDKFDLVELTLEYPRSLALDEEIIGELNEYLNPEKIAVENLFTDMRRLQGFLESEGYMRCLDVGHLVKRGEDPVLHYYENSDSVINLHLHGVIEGNDHQQIEPESENFNLVGLLEALQDKSYDGQLVLEQFKPEHLSRSIETITSAWREVRFGGEGA